MKSFLCGTVTVLFCTCLFLLLTGAGCSEEERQQMHIDSTKRWSKTFQERVFFVQESESKLCFAVIVRNGFCITHVPCEPVKNLIVSPNGEKK